MHKFAPPKPQVKDGENEALEKKAAVTWKLGKMLGSIVELAEQNTALAKWNRPETDALISLSCTATLGDCTEMVLGSQLLQ